MKHLIEKHLYHKAPNLLLENVEDLSQEGILTSLSLTREHPLIQGHFPGLPVFPGTQMLEMLIQSAGLYMSEVHYPDHREQKLSIGIFRKCDQAVFKNIARPTQKISAHIFQLEQIDRLHSFKGHVTDESGTLLMKAKFSLAVIDEDQLRGL